jgi:hypothetical protein
MRISYTIHKYRIICFKIKQLSTFFNSSITFFVSGRRTGQRRGSQNNDSQPNNTHRRRNSAVENGNFSTGNVELHVNSSDVWEALVAIREARLRRESEREFHLEVERRDNQWMPRQNSSGVSVNIPRSSHTVRDSKFLNF